MIEIREERFSDLAAVREINIAAFEGEKEADLVDRLRDEEIDLVSLVADRDGEIVGHLLLSPVNAGDAPIRALGLGPMGVRPDLQRTGIGGMLVEAAVTEAKRVGAAALFVLGHPEYYPRFGFEAARPYGFGYKEPEYDPYFFLMELSPGGLDGHSGDVEYHPAFEVV
jgi:putative acetyltransferase